MKSPVEEALFALALRKPAAERAAFLERECGEACHVLATTPMTITAPTAASTHTVTLFRQTSF